MAKPTQVELMTAHKTARNHALEATANGVKTSNGVILTPEATLEPFAQSWPDHPFSGNENNKRVAQRIAATSQETPTTVVVKTPQQAAQEQLAKAAAYEGKNPDEKPTSGVIQPGTREALLAGVQTGSTPAAPTILPPAPVPPAPVPPVLPAPVPPAPPAASAS